MATSTCTLVVKAIKNLGGPSIDPGDIEWALDIPAGQEIIHWFLAQCAIPDTKDEQIEDILDADLGAALRAITLEYRELQILKHFNNDTSIRPDQEVNTIHTPSTYVLPSCLRKHADHVDKETALLEAEVATLRSRLKQMSRANHQVHQTISSLRSTITEEDTAIERMQEHLSELSVVADASLSTSAHAALDLLDILAPSEKANQLLDKPTNQTKHIIASSIQTLTDLANLRNEITDRHISNLAQTVPQPSTNLVKDSENLSRSLSELLNSKKLKEAAYALELRRIYDTLGHDESVPRSTTITNADSSDVDVIKSIENAWMLDQAAQLDIERIIYDSTIQAYQETILPALTALHGTLLIHEQAVQTAEAWVGALGIEVEGIFAANTDIDTLKSGPDEDTGLHGDFGTELELALKRLLLQHHQLRHSDSPPLVLLDRMDILSELHQIQQTVSEGGNTSGWNEVSQLQEKLSALNATHHPLLSVLYNAGQVQTHTTCPFGQSREINRLEQKTQEAAARLEVGFIQGEEIDKTLAGKRTQRKLEEFVDRWTAARLLQRT